jgi:hypothetical protein
VVHSGAAFRLDNNPTRMLVDNDIRYLENYTNPEYIFSSWDDKPMLIKSFTINVRVKKSLGYPIGEGLIFAANELSHLSDLSKFNKMTFE